ncbi:DgyrCDS2432 [Dimorphilus gyrociliatus]|uniref:Transmembrane protein 208 n=1 Tax=Dimorphilus gyrociliatus TaxID=2664684 RepID=A0A7I8VDC1_9ANNE|nr:DgyrCDS2432 [Dimorphilus gyrociliatus]
MNVNIRILQPKGKQGTKGQKQIATENQDTLRFYQILIGGVNTVYFALTFTFFWSSFTTFYMFLVCGVLATYYGSYKFMSSMATPTYAPDGSLFDAGSDLNISGGVSEHVKDVILLTAICQGLSLISNYFWLFLLLAPIRAFYLLWVNILGPWFFAPAPEPAEEEEKKAKKQERKMKHKIIR